VAVDTGTFVGRYCLPGCIVATPSGVVGQPRRLSVVAFGTEVTSSTCLNRRNSIGSCQTAQCGVKGVLTINFVASESARYCHLWAIMLPPARSKLNWTLGSTFQCHQGLWDGAEQSVRRSGDSPHPALTPLGDNVFPPAASSCLPAHTIATLS
jgi:hypothetical protein